MSTADRNSRAEPIGRRPEAMRRVFVALILADVGAPAIAARVGFIVFERPFEAARCVVLLVVAAAVLGRDS